MKLFEGISLTLVQFPHPSVKQREEGPGKVWVDEALQAGAITTKAQKVLKKGWRDAETRIRLDKNTVACPNKYVSYYKPKVRYIIHHRSCQYYK